jgi:hypothetical protein
MRMIRCLTVVLAGAAMLVGVAPNVSAGGTKEFADSGRGFTVRLPETFKQNPPKPQGDPKYQAANFYDDQAKYKSSGSVNPEFTIGWWSKPKVATTPSAGDTPKPDDKGKGSADHAPTREEMEDAYGPKSIDEVLDQLLTGNPHLFGKVEGPAASADRWSQAKTAKTNKQKIDFKYWEFAPGKPKKGEKPAIWYVFAARLTIDRPKETVEVTFHATCATMFIKDLGPEFVNLVKSFETKDSAGVAAREEIPTDPDKFIDWVKRTKVIAGWKMLVSPKKEYVIVYDEAVKDDLIKDIAEQIEGIRAQVYEVMFPPDKPVTAMSIIRVCKDKQGYMAYGGSPSSAGFWSNVQGELVFFKDSQNPNDALRVLYHEAFHQYIYYSAGAVSPHSWFNEGHGDFFAGHNHKGGGKFELGEFLWRKDLAQSLKREKKTVPLKEWLTWDQNKYYNKGANGGRLDGGENYALGWNFIYFLRTTKKAEYQQFLPVYFNTLKGLVTKAREDRKAARDKAKAAGEDLGEEEPEWLANRMNEDAWCQTALDAALKTVNLDQLEKDWLAF